MRRAVVGRTVVARRIAVAADIVLAAVAGIRIARISSRLVEILFWLVLVGGTLMNWGWEGGV